MEINGHKPKAGNNVWLAPNATVVGDVTLGDDCTVWFNAVIRGDVHSIRIGARTNIQDGAIIHCTYEKAPTEIGDDVSIGHSAIVHGCTVGNHVLIGMGAVVMDRAVVQEYCVIAAGAVVLENTVCESGWLYAGIPAKKVKQLDDRLKDILDDTPKRYVMYSDWFRNQPISEEIK